MGTVLMSALSPSSRAKSIHAVLVRCRLESSNITSSCRLTISGAPPHAHRYTALISGRGSAAVPGAVSGAEIAVAVRLIAVAVVGADVAIAVPVACAAHRARVQRTHHPR